MKHLEIRIDSLNKKIDSTSPNKEIIEEYRHLIYTYQFSFTLMIAIFALFGISLPIVLSLSAERALRKAQELLKKLEEDFEKSFDKHIQKNRDKLIDKAISYIKTKNFSFLNHSLSILSSYNNEGFNNGQVKGLINILKSEINKHSKGEISRILLKTKNNKIKDYFIKFITNNPSGETCIWGALYFARYNHIENIELVAKIVINSYPLLGMISSLLGEHNKNFVVALLNSESLVSGLSKEMIEQSGNHLLTSYSGRLEAEDIESTLFYRKYQESLNK